MLRHSVFLITWTVAIAHVIDLPPSLDDPEEIFESCFRDGDNDLHCDFGHIKTPIEIHNIGKQQSKSKFYIDNAIEIKVRGRICSDVQFTNSLVDLKEASACPVKLEFISNTNLNRLPKDVTNIVISNSEIGELKSKTLQTAEISDAEIHLVNIESPYLKDLTVRNTIINRLNKIDLPTSSVVTFISSELIEVKDESFSYNGGVLELHDTRIIYTASTMPIKNNTVESNSLKSHKSIELDSKPDKSPHGPEIALAILSVSVAVLIVIQFVKFLRSYKKRTDSNLRTKDWPPQHDIGYHCSECDYVDDDIGDSTI